MQRLFVFGSILISLVMAQVSSASEATEFVRIPSTFSGPSGLLFTQSIDTLEPGRFEVGLGLIQEEGNVSAGGDASITQFSQTFTMGLTDSIEVSAQIPYFAKIDQPGSDESELGDINLSIKWRFLEPSTELNFPGFGLSLTGFFPTGDRKIGAGTVDSWGLKALVVSSAEVEIGISNNSFLVGFYADGGIYIQDSGDNTEESHGIVDLGLLVPLNVLRDIQLLLEGSARTNRETRFGNDYVGLTAGLRYVTRHAALNGGWQYRFNEAPFDDSNLFVLHGSYYF